MPSKSSIKKSPSNGFTLIETIVGIVVLAISFSVMTSLIYPITQHSADQYHQIKAAELGQSLMNEIQSKAFDNNSDFTSGQLRCGEAGASDCTDNAYLTCEIEEENNSNDCDRTLFDDVDDYNGLALSGSNFDNSFGQDISHLYVGYSVEVNVCNDADYSGTCTGSEGTSVAKKITITVTTPTDFDIVFTSYRANF